MEVRFIAIGRAGLLLSMLITLEVAFKHLAFGEPLTQVGDGFSNIDSERGERTVYACNGSPLVLKCQNSSQTQGLIKVTRANFGRFSIALCNEDGRTDWSVNCFMPKAKKVISESCDDKEDCSVSADDFDLGPDPCPDTERYLEAHYICIQTAIAKPTEYPAWQKGSNDLEDNRPSINSRRKPERHIPITAPPTKSPFEPTSTPYQRNRRPETPPPATKPPKPETPMTEESVSAAPVFYENPNSQKEKVNGQIENLVQPETSPPPLPSTSPTTSTVQNAPAEERFVDVHSGNGLDGQSRNQTGLTTCPAHRFRGIQWPETATGSTSRKACPNNFSLGKAVWDCVIGEDAKPEWKNNWPDLSRCQSSWTNVLESDTENGKSELTEVAETLEKQISTSAIYGGDLAPILSIVTSTFSRIKAETENDIVSIDDRDDQFFDLVEKDVVHKLARSLSWLLENEQVAAWQDLAETTIRKSTLEKFLRTCSDLGDVIQKLFRGKKRSKDEPSTQTDEIRGNVVTKIATPNIYLTLQKLTFEIIRSRQIDFRSLIRFRPRVASQTDVSAQAGIELIFDSTSSNLTERDVQIVTLAVRNIDRVLDIDGTEERDGTGSAVISVDSLSKNKQGVMPVLHQVIFVVPVMSITRNNARCMYWSVSHYWTSEGCHGLDRNSTHVTCKCVLTSTSDTLWTRFTLSSGPGPAMVEDGDQLFEGGGIFRSAAFDDLSTSTIIIVAVCASLLVASLLAAALLIIYCKRVKIRDKKWEDRACYLRKSNTTYEVNSLGNNDYSELGLLAHQSQQQQYHPQQTTLLLKGRHSPNGRHNSLGVLACIASGSQQQSPMNEIQIGNNAHINLLHTRSESDIENDVEGDRYHNYEVVRSSSSYTTTLNSSSTPHLLLGGTMARQGQSFDRDSQGYSAYYRSFGRSHNKIPATNESKFSKWIKTKLSRGDSHGSQHAGIAVRTLRPDEFSYSGANSLKKMSELNNGGAAGPGGGSLALLLRHKNCPVDNHNLGQRFLRRDQEQDVRESPTLSLRSENIFLPDQFGNSRRYVRPDNNFASFTTRRPGPLPDGDVRSYVGQTQVGVERSANLQQWSNTLRNQQQQHHRMINDHYDVNDRNGSGYCPAILSLPPPPPPPSIPSQRLNKSHRHYGEDELIMLQTEQLGQDPWLSDAIYHLPLDNSLSKDQRHQKQNLLRFSSSSSTSDDPKHFTTTNGKARHHDATTNGTRQSASKRSGGKKKRKGETLTPTSTTVTSQQHQQQPIYMEVEDAEYRHDISDFTSSGGSSTNNGKGGNGFSPSATTDGFSSASTASSTSSSGPGPKAIQRAKTKSKPESGLNAKEVVLAGGKNMIDND